MWYNQFKIKCRKPVGAFIGRPHWWYCLLIHITFDVMKIVCVAHELENTVLPYIITTTLFHLWIFKQSQSLCLYLRASNERPYRIAQTKNYTMLGHNMFLILQTIFTNRVRRLAVRASNERPYRIVQTKNYTMLGHNMFLILQTIYTNGVRRLAVRYFTNKIEN